MKPARAVRGRLTQPLGGLSVPKAVAQRGFSSELAQERCPAIKVLHPGLRGFFSFPPYTPLLISVPHLAVGRSVSQPAPRAVPAGGAGLWGQAASPVAASQPGCGRGVSCIPSPHLTLVNFVKQLFLCLNRRGVGET